LLLRTPVATGTTTAQGPLTSRYPPPVCAPCTAAVRVATSCAGHAVCFAAGRAAHHPHLQGPVHAGHCHARCVSNTLTLEMAPCAIACGATRCAGCLVQPYSLPGWVRALPLSLFPTLFVNCSLACHMMSCSAARNQRKEVPRLERLCRACHVGETAGQVLKCGWMIM
jgi:hypothetical protein